MASTTQLSLSPVAERCQIPAQELLGTSGNKLPNSQQGLPIASPLTTRNFFDTRTRPHELSPSSLLNENRTLKARVANLEQRYVALEQKITQLTSRMEHLCLATPNHPPLAPTRQQYAIQHVNVARDFLRKASHEDALRHANAAIALNPKNVAAHSIKSECLRLLNRMVESLDAADDTLILKPDSIEALTNKGFALKTLGYTELALDAFDEALKLLPSNLFALRGKIETLFLLSNREECLQTIGTILEYYPNDPVAMKWLSELSNTKILNQWITLKAYEITDSSF